MSPFLLTAYCQLVLKLGHLTFEDNAFHVRDGRKITIRYKIAEGARKIRWYNGGAYYPVHVSDFETVRVGASIRNFPSLARVDGRDYVVGFFPGDSKEPRTLRRPASSGRVGFADRAEGRAYSAGLDREW